MSALLEVNDLRVSFPLRGGLPGRTRSIEAVAGVSLQLQAGETLGIVGESGSGKTTLARAITGLVPVSAGSVRFEAQELVGLDQRAFQGIRRRVAMMFQDPVGSLSPRLTVRSLITEPFKIHGIKGKDLDAEAKRLLKMVGLTEDFAGRFPFQLSGGQARRVGVARALALEPALIVADEPTAGLDVSVQGEILNLLARLQQELGLAILIITHNLNVVRHITDRMAIMYLGRVVESGPTEPLFAAPHHPYTLALLSANPEPDPDAVMDRLEISGEVPSLLKRPPGCEFHTRCPFRGEGCDGEFPAAKHEGEHHFHCYYPR